MQKGTTVKIYNEDQLRKVFPFLRASKSFSFDAWVEQYGMPNFPKYLEYTPIGMGFTSKPCNTWTRETYEVIDFKDSVFSK